MVPIWVGIDIGAAFPIQSVIALAAIAATAGAAKLSITRFDLYFFLFLTASLVALVLGGSSAALWLQFPIRWGIPYLAARVVVSATGTRFATDLIAVVFALVGSLAVIELLAVWHPFVGWATDSPEFEIWNWIQDRGGRDRSEWAFGHSIALGGALAMSVPFVMSSSFNGSVKTIMVLAVGAGVAVTGSRGAMLAAALTMATYLLFRLKKPLERSGAMILMTLVAIFAIPSVTPAFETFALGSTEEQTSFAYRGQLYSRYLSTIEMLGPSQSIDWIRSTDSAVLHIGLQFGWIVLIIAIFPLAVIILRVISGRASIAEISLFGQLPLFGTVALITQYQLFVFFVAGVAVQMSLENRTIKQKSSGGTLESGGASASTRSTLSLQPALALRNQRIRDGKGRRVYGNNN